jgi:hypothetical protein
MLQDGVPSERDPLTMVSCKESGGGECLVRSRFVLDSRYSP